MILTFRPLTDLSVFTTDPADRKPNRFSVTHAKNLEDLEYELEKLEATEVFVQVALADPVRHVKLDGSLHAKAVVTHPGVVLTIVSAKYGTLVYPCDRFEGLYSNDPPSWRINLRAIVLGLAALRKLEDYGIADRGQQYAGFRELGSGSAHEGQKHDRASLLRFLGLAAGWDTSGRVVIDDVDVIEAAYHDALRAHHPDRGGSASMMASVNVARDELLRGGHHA